jgi:hypothetical protein
VDHLGTSVDEPHSHMLGMVVVDSPSATPHCPQRQASKRKLDFSQLNSPAAAPPPPILIEANQAGQEGIATLPVLVISMQAV